MEKEPMFETFTGQRALPPHFHGGVLAIGNFDGVHRGHQAVIAEALEIAAREGRPALALTFEPHPRSFFRPEAPVFRLTPLKEKLSLFEALGLQGAIIKDFDAALASMSAEDFVALLQDELKAALLVAGHDFHFGKGRSGTPDVLKTLAEKRGMQVTLVTPQNDAAGAPISSSAIRTALEAGEVTAANDLLGYRWFVQGEVQHGDKRGRLLGFPTANIALSQDCRLKHGVYTARARAGEYWFGAAVHFGGRIQFGGGPPVLEAYLLDFNGDLYGQELRIEFIDFLRAEAKFDHVDGLVEQMHRDAGVARARIAEAVRKRVSPLQAKLEQGDDACEAGENAR